MSEHSTATKMTNSHAPTPLGSVANTLSTQHHQKVEPIDYTADESMIAVSGEKKQVFRAIENLILSMFEIGFYGCFTSA